MTLDFPVADDTASNPTVAPAAPAAKPASTAALMPDAQTVTAVHHWTDRLFSFRVTRPASLRFRSGEFVMIGLPGEDGGKPVLRAYSIASPCWDEQLEFFSIKVPDGPLTSRLQKIEAGDTVLMGKKPTGTLVLDALTGGERLFLIGTTLLTQSAATARSCVNNASPCQQRQALSETSPPRAARPANHGPTPASRRLSVTTDRGDGSRYGLA